MANVVIVAIPSPDDYVWKISSEKVPHLTLLNLGEQTAGMNLPAIEDFLQHVVNTSMHRFGLSVDHRGELGENKADVLFFANRTTRMLEQNRAYLLGNSDIKKAYNSTTQFPVWVPHLTLGFPETPAKPDKRDYPGIWWINFDKIALWLGDFTGPEFPLKECTIGGEMSMSYNTVDDVLAHFGVRGQKWGVRRRSTQLVGGSEDAMNAHAAKIKAKQGGTKALSNKELQDLVTRMNLEQQFSRLQPPSKGKQVAKFVADTLAGVGKQQATKFASDQATKLVAQALKK